VGSQVGPGTVLCMVEAMKIFHELKAETSGKIVKILVKNAEAVKEGQELFWIE
jgi:acetyl-CoA carboxylase biotin carboxyl carrier protein